MLYLTPRGCWYTALGLFSILLLLLLTLTDLNYGFCYAISFGSAVLVLFTSAAHAVFILDRTRAPSLRPR